MARGRGRKIICARRTKMVSLRLLRGHLGAKVVVAFSRTEKGGPNTDLVASNQNAESAQARKGPHGAGL